MWEAYMDDSRFFQHLHGATDVSASFQDLPTTVGNLPLPVHGSPAVWCNPSKRKASHQHGLTWPGTGLPDSALGADFSAWLCFQFC